MRTDEELASAAQRGDRAAAQTLLSRYQDRLLGMAMRLLRNRQDAQEAVQQGMFKALANIDKYDASRPFSPWVFRVVRNVCVDVHRRRKPKDEVDDRTMASTTFEDGGSRYFRSAESRLQQQQLNDALSEAIDGLGDASPPLGSNGHGRDGGDLPDREAEGEVASVDDADVAVANRTVLIAVAPVCIVVVVVVGNEE